MNLNDFTIGLDQSEGFYYSKGHSVISYPDNGNNVYFDIEETSFWFRHRNDCICEAVKIYSPDKVFFDIGGGNGFVSKALEDIPVTVVLVEPGRQGCINAKSRGLKNIICSSWEEAHFKAEALPAVGLFDVVEHIKEDSVFLRSIYRSLQKDGLIFITVPAFQALWSYEDVEAGHYRRYTLMSLKSLLTEIGFKVEYSTYLFSFLPAPIFLFRTLKGKIWRKKKNDAVKGEHKKGNGILATVIDVVNKWERKRIRKGKTIPFGSTCFVVARKL